MQTKLRKIVWGVIPAGGCNLRCSYCYIGDKTIRPAAYKYSVARMLEGLHPKRFGGPILLAGTGDGETFLWKDIVPFTEGMLSYGHAVCYITNMTITPVITKFCAFDDEFRSRLAIKASMHFLELKRKNLLTVFFSNLRMLKSAGISIAILLCISKTYLPYLREISDLCKKELGILPIAGMSRSYDVAGGKLDTNYSSEDEVLVYETCDCRQWEMQKHIYGTKRTEFCHSGEYALSLDLGTGDYTKCWGHSGKVNTHVSGTSTLLRRLVRRVPVAKRIFGEEDQVVGNLFRNIKAPLNFEPIVRCPFYDCTCASYLCAGVIPELDIPTLPNVYFTKKTCSNELWALLDQKIVQ
jgi:MoaA/NifB/PqqE/SkfB family radical SAM enzyme